MKKLLPILLSLFLPLFARPASAAAFSPLQIGVGWPRSDLQLVSSNTPVIGLRLNLIGSYNETAAGLDLGLFSVSDTFSGIRLNAVAQGDTVNGISLGLFDGADTLNGLQIAPIAIALDACGLQIGLFNWSDDLHGVQIGLVNNGQYLGSHSHVHGMQISFLNATGTLQGSQLGICNTTRELHGVQIGIFNFADTFHGLQIGLVNIVSSSDFPCLPLLRASF